ncbi:hypothetical protein BV25DRAFT_1921519 [Artomyces pyxidatus]|uniref:Uncharacterized protein n=1 Tax=Artomyces pyxidatus TaxID=48021 RepID=A0ACB8SIS1_9AGAM|nr:hypothetical protein BV25DRAFT_1921519 [Artomyces pyxidatus]
MASFHDPGDALRYYVTLSKLTYVLCGVYIWDVVTTCEYELSILRGKRPFRWTVCVYICIRVSTFAVFVAFLVEAGFTGWRNCQVFQIVYYSFAYLAISASSFIIVLRVTAVWSYDRTMTAVSTIIWSVSTALNFHDVSLTRAVYDPYTDACMPASSSKTFRVSFIAMLVSIGSTRMYRELSEYCTSAESIDLDRRTSLVRPPDVPHPRFGPLPDRDSGIIPIRVEPEGKRWMFDHVIDIKPLPLAHA